MKLYSRRKLAVVLGCLIAVLAAGVAQAGVPSAADRADAKRFARQYWEDRGYYAPCYGVAIRVGRIGRNLGAVFPYSRPCTIWLSREADWTDGGTLDAWWKVCAIVIHEYGHVVGKRHNRNPESIMAASEGLNLYSTWWPYFDACRYNGDDEDGDGRPDW